MFHMSRRSMRAPTVAALVVCLLLVSECSSGSSSTSSKATNTSTPASPVSTSSKPNIVFILADDLDLTSYADPAKFPRFNSLMTEQGTTFSNYFVTDSLCCPSRSSILRGEYVHNHGVHTNLPPTGGFEQFHALGNETSTIATWMHAAGYHTGLLGKYLNGYPNTVARRYVPPGWDDWVSPSGGNPYAEYNYQLNDNGTLVHHGTQPSDYLVDVLSQKAGDFIGNAPKDKPFFLYVAPYVPHQPATPAPRHANAFPGAQAPRPPSFDQVDSTAPAWLRDRPPLTNPLITTIDKLYRRRLQTMLGVDDMLANVVSALQKSGQLDNTYIVFSSDNGFHLGEHRLPPGKQTAFDEDIHVPLVVRGPRVPRGKTVDNLAENVDLAPTFAALGHAKVPDFVNGQSLVPALHGTTASSQRSAVLVEHYADTADELGARKQRQRRGAAATTTSSPDDDTSPPVAGLPTSGPTAPVLRAGQVPLVLIPSYAALRTDRYTYVEYTATGERELYDLTTDPFELHNIAATADPILVARLAKELDALRTCTGAACRSAGTG
jgi:N-acetylglucosamine-6-sulfatase